MIPPVPPPQRAESQRDGAVSPDQRGPILIVEDSPTQSLQLKSLLEGGGWTVEVATDGGQALAAMKRQRPVAVLSDIVMPDIDGYELCRAIRRDPELAGVPVVLLTTLSDPVDVIKGLACGADNLLVKPYDEELLLACVARLAQREDDCTRLPDGIRVTIGGQPHVVEAGPERIMRFLLSTYENAARQYRQLKRAQTQLRAANDDLKENLHRLAVSEDRFRSVLQTVPDIVYKVDREGHFVLVNDAVGMLGHQAEDLIGCHFSKIILPAEVDNVSREKVLPRYTGEVTGPEGAPLLFDERRTGARMTRALEVRLVPKSARDDGEEAPETIAEVNSSGLYEAEVYSNSKSFVGSVGVIRDITRRKEVERELARHRDHLEELVRERTAAIDASNAILREQISERQRAETRLTESERILNSTGKIARIGGWEHDLATGKAVWTEALYDIAEVPHDADIPGVDEHLDYYPSPDREVLEEAYNKAVESGAPFDLELRVNTAKGKPLWCRVQGEAVQRDGQCVQVRGTLQDITERKQAEEKLVASELRYRRLFESAKDGILILDAETGAVVDVNPFLTSLLGISREAFLGKHIWELGCFEDAVASRASFAVLQEKGYVRYDDLPLETGDGRRLDVEFVSNVYAVNTKKVIQCNIRDITVRKQAENREQLSRDVLAMLNRSGGAAESIGEILGLVKQATGIEAVGIRLRDGDDFPYYATDGFPGEFVEMERYLCARDKAGHAVRDTEGNPVLECMCGNILRGRIDPKFPFFTEGGSFWTNCTTDLLASTTEEDRQARTRNRCNGEGYESLALVPLRSGDEVIGLLQLNDHRRGQFTLEMIQFFEGLGASIGIALARDQARAEIDALAKFPSENPSPVLRVAKDGTLLDVNPAALRLLPEWRLRVDQPVPPMWVDIVGSVLKKGTEQVVDIKHGKQTYAFAVTPIVDGGYANLYGRDITATKGAEEALRASEAQLSNALQMARAGHWEYDVDSDTFTFNDSFYRIFWTTAEEVGGYRMRSAQYTGRFCHPDDAALVGREVLEAIEATDPGYNRQFEHRILYADGEVGFITVRFFIVKDSHGRTVKTYGVNQDITERKRASEALRDSEQTLSAIFQSASDGLLLADGETHRFVTVNEAMCRMLGYSAEEIMELSVADIHPSEALASVSAVFERQRRGEIDLAADIPVKRKDGTVFFADISSAPLEIHGRPHLLGAFRDITDRKRAEEALQEERAFAASLVETAQAIILVLSPEGDIVTFNPYMEKISGYRVDEVRGKNWVETFIPEEDRADIRELLEKAMAGTATVGNINDIVAKDGRRIAVEWYDSRLETPDGDVVGLLSTGQDVTARTQLEAQLLQSQKMEAVGQLAGGVAHDFNNILTGIKGYVGFALEGAEEGTQAHEDLTETLHLAQRAAHLTRQLLTFSRQQPFQPVPLNVNTLIADLNKMLGRLIGEHIELRFLPADELGDIHADPSQIQQVIMNLVINARDAMPQGGTLTVETGTAALDHAYTETHVDVQPGTYVLMAVTDTGCGMDKATLARVFEPFFTTKEVGRGTGLGLATAYGVVREHGGHIWVYSEPGVGTTFKVYLPLARDEEAAEPDAGPPERAVSTGSETLLVTEDEASVRRVASVTLQRQGHTVLLATTADEAERLFDDHAHDVALLLTDVLMPGRTGPELYAALREKKPDLKVLYMSGYSGGAVPGGILDDGAPFLPKPFDAAQLVRRVREVLDS